MIRTARPNNWDMRKFDFGEGVGINSGYSMFFEELHSIPEMYPALKNTGFYIAGSNLLADLILTPIIVIGLKIAPKRGIRPLGKLMWWAMNRSRPPYRVVLKVEAAGQLDGRQVQFEASIEHTEVRKPELHRMGHLADPVHLLHDMEQMGVRLKTSIR